MKIEDIVARILYLTQPFKSHLLQKIDRDALVEAITILERVKRLEEMDGKQSPWLEDVVDFLKTGEGW
jgi:hypothetical protein